MMSSLRAPLQAGLAELNIEQAGLADRLLDYLALLVKWNRAFNLTAVRDPEQMLYRHLLDSLAILPWVQGARLLDVGSGAGLPGIPLALARPQLQVVLLDSNGKKARFLRQAKLELDLGNVEVAETRVEAYGAEPRFDSIVSRAFASLGDLVRLTEPLLAPTGRWLAMKGRLDENELAEVHKKRYQLHCHRLTVPGLDALRHLVEIRRNPAG